MEEGARLWLLLRTRTCRNVESRSRSSGFKEDLGSSDAEPAAPDMSAQPIIASLRAEEPLLLCSDTEHAASQHAHLSEFKNQSKRGNYH